jgi:hypothetical protein
MTEFRVVLDGVELSEEQEHQINASIQKAVLPHLAGFGVAEKRPIVAIADKLRWRGIWIGPLAQDVIDRELPQVNEELGRF